VGLLTHRDFKGFLRVAGQETRHPLVLKPVLDILDAIQAIEKYATGARNKTDELIQVWFVHHLQIIGEAARKLSPAFQERHPEVPWAQIVAMRHILVHDYFAVDLDEVWAAIERDVPELKRKIVAILAELKPGGKP